MLSEFLDHFNDVSYPYVGGRLDVNLSLDFLRCLACVFYKRLPKFPCPPAIDEQVFWTFLYVIAQYTLICFGTGIYPHSRSLLKVCNRFHIKRHRSMLVLDVLQLHIPYASGSFSTGVLMDLCMFLALGLSALPHHLYW